MSRGCSLAVHARGRNNQRDRPCERPRRGSRSVAAFMLTARSGEPHPHSSAGASLTGIGGRANIAPESTGLPPACRGTCQKPPDGTAGFHAAGGVSRKRGLTRGTDETVRFAAASAEQPPDCRANTAARSGTDDLARTGVEHRSGASETATESLRTSRPKLDSPWHRCASSWHGPTDRHPPRAGHR